MTDLKKIRPEDYAFSTRAVRAGQEHTHEGENSEPIFPTSSYVFASAAEAAARFSGEQPGNIYSRFTNPTVRVFEERLAAMEGAERCVATASGMSAITATCIGLLKTGDHIVSSAYIYGGTYTFFQKQLERFRIDVTFVDATSIDAVSEAVTERTKLVFVETIANPRTQVTALREIGELCEARGLIYVVDNTMTSPYLFQPTAVKASLILCCWRR